MKIPLVLLFATVLLASKSYYQDDRTVYQVGNTGCSAYFSCRPNPAEWSYSPDSSKVYTMECTGQDGITYSLIAVDLLVELSGEDVEAVLSSYMDFLKTEINITSSLGYHKGYNLPAHPSATVITDTWTDADSEISVLGCSNGKIIAVLLIFNKKTSVQTVNADLYFNGFRFPGD